MYTPLECRYKKTRIYVYETLCPNRCEPSIEFFFFFFFFGGGGGGGGGGVNRVGGVRVEMSTEK